MRQKLRSIPPVYFLACLVVTLLLSLLLPSLNWIHFPFTVCGFLFLGVGTIFISGAHRSLTHHATPVNFAPSTCLVKNGLYQFSRNPMYVGFVLFLAGFAMSSGNVLAMSCPLFLFFVLDRMFIPYEEEKMWGTFGKEYLEYKQKVRRWI